MLRENILQTKKEELCVSVGRQFTMGLLYFSVCYEQQVWPLFVPDCLFKDMCIVTALRDRVKCLPPEQRVDLFIAHYKWLKSPRLTVSLL